MTEIEEKPVKKSRRGRAATADRRIKVEVSIDNLRTDARSVFESTEKITNHGGHGTAIRECIKLANTAGEIRANIERLPEKERKPWLLLLEQAEEDVDGALDLIADRADEQSKNQPTAN